MQNKASSSVNGFTIIEILVVLLIIGITMGVALLAFGDFGKQRRILMAAEQLINDVNLVQQQAILETSTLGIRFNQNTYQVVRFQTPHHWQVMPGKSIFHQQHFPKDAVIRFKHLPAQKNAPQIMVYSSGDMSPFTLTISLEHQHSLITIIGKSNGEMILRPQGTP
jgi:general secretion pathway protein H